MDARLNRPCPEGIAAGKTLAKLHRSAVHAIEQLGKAPECCSSCAFVEGTIPNGCLETVADALKCVSEKVPFLCHAKGKLEKGEWCAGYTALALTTSHVPVLPAPYDFSHECTDDDLEATEVASSS